MSAFIGKWEQMPNSYGGDDSVTFAVNTGYTKEEAEKMIEHMRHMSPIWTISKEGDKWTYKFERSAMDRTFTFQSGEEFETKAVVGAVKMKVTIQDDVIYEEHHPIGNPERSAWYERRIMAGRLISVATNKKGNILTYVSVKL